MNQIPAGWYPDPQNPALQRYWDGSTWTDHTNPAADAGAGAAAATAAGGDPGYGGAAPAFGSDPGYGGGAAGGYPVASGGGYAMTAPGGYPAMLEIERQPQYDKLRALIRSPGVPFVNFVWLVMLLPHLLALLVLGIGAVIVYIISCFAVLFTGRYPRGMFDYMVGVQRWSHRVAAWIFLLTDAYPPFSFDPNAHPLAFDVAYPENGVVPRWRGIPFLSYILAIPIVIVAEVILLIGYLLIYLPPIIPGVIPLCILFTGGYPEPLFNLVRGGLRLLARGQAYATFMVKPYPPFDF